MLELQREGAGRNPHPLLNQRRCPGSTVLRHHHPPHHLPQLLEAPGTSCCIMPREGAAESLRQVKGYGLWVRGTWEGGLREPGVIIVTLVEFIVVQCVIENNGEHFEPHTNQSVNHPSPPS